MPPGAGHGNVSCMSTPTPPGPPRPEIAELAWITAELGKLEEARRPLLARRAVLVAELARPRRPEAPAPSVGPPPPDEAVVASGGRREMSRRTVARLLLAAGGALVMIAAAVFTVANWGSMGAAGRVAVLLAVTALALAAPWPLARRGLAATAEAAAAVGLALTLADADLAGRLVSGGPRFGLGAAALACAALAAAWAAYGWLAPIRGPRPAAIGLAQFPLALAAGSIPAPRLVVIALAVTAAADVTLAAWAGRATLAAERRVASVAAVAAAVVAAGTAVVTVPAALGPATWAALVALTALAAALLAAGSRLADRRVAATAATAGLLVAAAAACWSLTGPPVAAAELAVLAVVCGAAGWTARFPLPGALATAGTVAAAAGLACAAALASGLPVRYAAFAVLGVAVAAAGAAEPLRRSRPVHALVLEVGAGPVTLIALAMASPLTATASALAALVALLAAIMAWRWRGLGPRRGVALAAAGLAALVALGPQLAVLARAAFSPHLNLVQPWRGVPPAPMAPAGLGFALAVLGACAVAAVIAAGAWRGRAGGLDALAVVLPLVAAPAVVAAGLAYVATVGALLALTVGLAGWAAVSRSFAPAGAALVAASLTLAWALAAPLPTLAVLGGLAAAGAVCAWRAPLAAVRAGAAAASVLCVCALAACAALAAGWAAWQAGLAALAAVAAAQYTAARLARSRPGLSLAVEVAGLAAAVVATTPGLRDPRQASVVLTVTGTICLCVALRPGRRVLLWLGLAQGEAALWAWLASAGVHAPEPYTAPAATVLLAVGWRRWRRPPPVSSWITYGPGLAVLLVPSLVAVWLLPGWARPLVLGVAAAAIALAGGRARLLAPLLLGSAVVVLDAGHELAPAVQQLAGMVPRWVPIAVIGVVLLAVGATYEARLRDLGRIRAALGRMR
jgi:hypothetical protein